MMLFQTLILLFQSTPPARGATSGYQYEDLRLDVISIHAPREGGDLDGAPGPGECQNFNPRPPRGGRPISIFKSNRFSKFQSTPPARGATNTRCRSIFGHYISIHAPREGGDQHSYTKEVSIKNFNPRPPRGGRPGGKNMKSSRTWISIHAPREGGDLMFLRRGPRNFLISIHAPREGGDFALPL